MTTGAAEGTAVKGVREGGKDDVATGTRVGLLVDATGATTEGELDGFDDGVRLGDEEGILEGVTVGRVAGISVGSDVGVSDGVTVGKADGV